MEHHKGAKKCDSSRPNHTPHSYLNFARLLPAPLQASPSARPRLLMASPAHTRIARTYILTATLPVALPCPTGLRIREALPPEGIVCPHTL